jgi:hypothetical protein
MLAAAAPSITSAYMPSTSIRRSDGAFKISSRTLIGTLHLKAFSGRQALRADPSCRTASAVADVAVCVTVPGYMNAVEEVRGHTSSV